MPWVPGLAVRVLTHEGARSGRQTVVDALMGLVRREDLAGITVTRALEGYSKHGSLRTSSVVELGDDLPLMIEIADRAERIEPLLPEIAALVSSGMLTVTDARLYFPASRLLVKDIMSPPGPTVDPETPLVQVLQSLLAAGARLIPVVAADGALQGVITLGHLLRHVDPALAAHLTEGQAGDHAHQHLVRLLQGQTASACMQPRPHVLQPDVSVEAAARSLTTHGVTRVPVVDAAGHVVGMLNEHEVVAALVAPLQKAPTGELSTALRRSVLPAAGEPLAAGALTDRNIPLITENTPLDAVIAAMEGAPAHVVLVVAPDGRAQGVIDEHAVLKHVIPAESGGAGAAIGRLLARAPLQVLAALRGRSGKPLTAHALMRPPLPIVPEQMPVVDALAEMLRAEYDELAVVVDADQRTLGILWRYVALRALVGG
jgi:CBS domain-containing protein